MSDLDTERSTYEEVKGLYYVILRSKAGEILKVYRHRNEGQLKALKRPPRAVTGG